ncbi:uncharacterized protein LOC122503963 isoform X2 [Leptopilina heterotoma]|uniref:uncharacterized protein LOC122503963 isoform X2 n=1 Tax=Leptopilina heterotoma TaxID=63436 RepID=UPI001CA9537B|nr:uncharacterized protein LOC122503963 isoform X2 [Leptopilina heterotoma]
MNHGWPLLIFILHCTLTAILLKGTIWNHNDKTTTTTTTEEPKRTSTSSSREREGAEIKPTTEKSVTTSTTTTTTTEEPDYGDYEDYDDNDIEEDYNEDNEVKEPPSPNTPNQPENKKYDVDLMSHFKIATKFFRIIKNLFECKKTPENDNTPIAESNIPLVLDLLVESVQRNVQKNYKSPLKNPYINITQEIIKLMPKDCGAHRVKNNETVFKLWKIIKRYKKNFPTQNDSVEYAKCYASCLAKLNDIRKELVKFNLESRTGSRRELNKYLSGQRLGIKGCRKLKSGPETTASTTITTTTRKPRRTSPSSREREGAEIKPTTEKSVTTSTTTTTTTKKPQRNSDSTAINILKLIDLLKG